jgi:predicted phosphodiesterase
VVSNAPLSEAEIIDRLKVVEQYGSPSAAARVLGISRDTLRHTLAQAAQRGLTAASVPTNETERWKTKALAVQRELASIERDNISASEIRRTLYRLADITPDPPKWIATPTKAKAPGIPMTIWSDWHYGEVVFADQVGGVNSFDRAVAKTRVKRLVDSTMDLCFNHMVNPSYPGIIVCLGGDMISGSIHDELRETNDGPVQMSLLEVQEQLIMGLTAMAEKFGKVFVPCVVGNHGRTTLKPRAKNRVFESYEWNLYCQLERYFANDRRVQFAIPNEADVHFNVLGHRFCLTHGDTLGVKGGDGIIGAIGPITRGAIKVGRSSAQLGRDFDTLLMGHWHSYVARGDTTPVIVNGSLKGYDEYARLMLRVPYSVPSQALWFVHGKYGITAQWRVLLEERKKTGPDDWVTWQK